MKRLATAIFAFLFFLIIASCESPNKPRGEVGKQEPESPLPKIAFSSNRTGTFQIYLMNGGGSNQKQLTYNSWNKHSPQFSPDGKKILYFTNKDEYYHKIFVMTIDGTNQRKLTSPNSVTDYYDDMYPMFQPAH